MGADIYLKSLYEPNREKWQPVFDEAVKARDNGTGSQAAVSKAYDAMYTTGYFRDPYNSYGLFANLRDPDGGDISWWRDVSAKMLDDDSILPIENAKALLARVKAAKIDLTNAKKVANDQHDKPPTVEHYEKFRAELVTILEQSIALGEPLECSL